MGLGGWTHSPTQKVSWAGLLQRLWLISGVGSWVWVNPSAIGWFLGVGQDGGYKKCFWGEGVVCSDFLATFVGLFAAIFGCFFLPGIFSSL